MAGQIDNSEVEILKSKGWFIERSRYFKRYTDVKNSEDCVIEINPETLETHMLVFKKGTIGKEQYIAKMLVDYGSVVLTFVLNGNDTAALLECYRTGTSVPII